MKSQVHDDIRLFAVDAPQKQSIRKIPFLAPSLSGMHLHTDTNEAV